MPALSLIVTTYRLGGLDVLFDSLAAQTFHDFELVLVDALYDARTKIVMSEARDRFLHVKHVRLDPHPFPEYAPASERNAGVVASTGDALLFLDDYIRLPPDFVARHAAFHADPSNRGRMLQGTMRVYALDARVRRYNFAPEDMAAFRAALEPGAEPSVASYLFSAFPMGEELNLPPDPLRTLGRAFDPSDARLFNLSVRRQLVYEADGFRTALDAVGLRGPNYFGVDLIERLVQNGAEVVLEADLVADVMMPIGDAGHHPQRTMKRSEIAEPVERMDGLRAPARRRRLRVAMVYGAFSSAIHGPFDLDGLYDRVGLTGSESSFFNLARELSKRGHEVVVFCDCAAEYDHPSGFKAMPLRTIQAFPGVEGVDAMIAWNEPDYLQFAPRGARRYCDQQLNDFGYCQAPNWRDLVDEWVSPSANHYENVMRPALEGAWLASAEKKAHEHARVSVIPNSVDLSLLASPAPARRADSVVWCSSPDRGLHHLLAVWPTVRGRVPGATLRIFYRLAPWLDRARDLPDEVGQRARYIEAALERLREGWGVEVLDVVPNRRMLRELQEACVLAYPCDPVRYTEGFGVSVLDAAAAGCVPIVSSADALPEVHVEPGAALCVPGPIDHNVWGAVIADRLASPRDARHEADMAAHARAHSMEAVADMWEQILP